MRALGPLGPPVCHIKDWGGHSVPKNTSYGTLQVALMWRDSLQNHARPMQIAYSRQFSIIVNGSNLSIVWLLQLTASYIQSSLSII